MYKIIQAIIDFNNDPNKYRISVAISIPGNKWKSFYKIVSKISEDTIIDVIETGEMLGTHQAMQIFHLIDKKLIYTVS
ncbi:MAG: hypothetical protein K9H64_15745 [Bacteroidales bacterium]|nr:hypothetical protein [Bacteroidales bacterium]MCF8457421.1 hypothetical protein [Bacteroidales bacterium]